MTKPGEDEAALAAVAARGCVRNSGDLLYGCRTGLGAGGAAIVLQSAQWNPHERGDVGDSREVVRFKTGLTPTRGNICRPETRKCS